MLLIEAADAVVVVLNSHAWEQAPALTFTAVRTWLPVLDLKENKRLEVLVAPVTDTPEMETRNSHSHDIRVDIGVLKKLEKANTAEIDPLAELAESFARHFRELRDRFGTGDKFLCLEALHQPVAAHEHIDQWRQFTSVIRLTIQASQ